MSTNADRTADTPLARWLTHPAFRGQDLASAKDLLGSGLLNYDGGIAANDLIDSGISAVDLCTYADLHSPDATPRRETTSGDEQHGRFLLGRLHAMSRSFPNLGLRDALGYAFLSRQVKGGSGDEPVLALIREWDAIGHASDGWALTAAGIMPGEAAETLAAGGALPDEAELVMMLALRPAVLPHA